LAFEGSTQAADVEQPDVQNSIKLRTLGISDFTSGV